MPFPSVEHLPWRNVRTPYRIFLAELLLVRTRSDVVARVFEEIALRYPDVLALEHHQGRIPEKVEELMKVPGLGLYTAAAVAAFAYGSSEVPADVNILRFLSRLTGLPMKHPTKGSPELRALLPLLSREQGGPEPEKLLDFTRLICHARRPRCGECPLQDDCWYASLTSPDRELP